jgi:uncharacterized membrane-anchored protein
MVNRRIKKNGESPIKSKLIKNLSSPSHMLFMFILGLVITISTYFVDKSGIIATLCWFVVTLLCGVRTIYQYTYRKKENKI